MEKAINVLAVLGSALIFLNLLPMVSNNVFLYVGFLCWAIMDVINAKLHADRHETKKVIVISLCGVVLFICAAAGFIGLSGLTF